MGELGGFLRYKREVSSCRETEERLKDWKEVVLPMSEERLRLQAARCMECGTPFCHALGCPLANLIPEFNDLVYQDLWNEAYDRLELTSNFPEITGRVCPAPCESSCTLSINDYPVSIKEIERALIEKAFTEGWVTPQPPSAESGKRVAVVGSGPSGLSAAQQLRRMGHSVIVYEQDSKLGGLLRYGIPEFKLEKSIIDRRLDIYYREGVEFETDVTIGEDISARYLRKKHDALVLAVGCREPRRVPVPGDELEGVHYAMDYLAASTRVLHGELPQRSLIDARNKRVLVLGGGDTGADCVGTANRQGAKKIYQFEIMPKPLDWQEGRNPEWPDFPRILRTSSSHEEGGERRWNIKTKKLYGRSVEVERGIFCRVEWRKGENGKWEMMEVPESEFYLDIDMVIIAAGFTGVRKSRLITDFGLELDGQGNIAVDSMQQTSAEGVFAAGDAVSGASLVVKAMYQGRIAADSVNSFLIKI
ncbi:MAG: glutamate synthase subunit beta [Spirochaetaceae bacterium]